MATELLLIVDADTLAGWRRPTASLAQLHAALADLRRQEPTATVAVVGDPSLKWALGETEREQLDEDIRHGAIVFAPAGAREGHVGFMAQIAEKARRMGLDPVAITDRAVPGARLGRVHRDGERWVFDLNAAAPTVTAAPSAGQQHRRRRGRG